MVIDKSYPETTVDSKGRYQEMVDTLRDVGCRMTPQRLALLHILSSADNHPSARQLYEELRQQFPTTSLATVYKTLNVLKDLGEVNEMGFGSGDNRYDAIHRSPHPHLVCMQCNRIVDADAAPLSAVDRDLAASTGFQIVSHRLEFFGICPDCQAKGDTN